jgi:hypothetical protein
MEGANSTASDFAVTVHSPEERPGATSAVRTRPAWIIHESDKSERTATMTGNLDRGPRE